MIILNRRDLNKWRLQSPYPAAGHCIKLPPIPGFAVNGKIEGCIVLLIWCTVTTYWDIAIVNKTWPPWTANILLPCRPGPASASCSRALPLDILSVYRTSPTDIEAKKEKVDFCINWSYKCVLSLSLSLTVTANLSRLSKAAPHHNAPSTTFQVAVSELCPFFSQQHRVVCSFQMTQFWFHPSTGYFVAHPGALLQASHLQQRVFLDSSGFLHL